MMMIEQLSVEELSSLDFSRQAIMLNEIMGELAAVSQATRTARDQVTNARIEVIQARRESVSHQHWQCEFLRHKNELDKLRDRAHDLRTWSSIIQTLLRAGSP